MMSSADIFHVTPITPNAAIFDVCADRNLMVSFYRPDQLSIALQIAAKLMADNGRYSEWVAAMKAGKEWSEANLDNRPYYDWLAPFIDRPDTVAIMPDIPGAPSQLNERSLMTPPQRQGPTAMTDEAARELKAARAIYVEYGVKKAEAAGDVVSLDWIKKVHAGEADDAHGVQIALLALRTRPTDDLAVAVEALREAGQSVIDRMFSTYKARNGREVGIEGDDGEKCWIVHGDDIEGLRTALSKLTGEEA